MKIWNSYGSEHSSNMVLIGRFLDIDDAAKAKAIIDQLFRYADGKLEELRAIRKFPQEDLEFFIKNAPVLQPSELEQFCYEVNVKLSGKDIIITTDEYDLSAFIKIMATQGGRVEIYSAHSHKATGHGRGS